MRLKRHILLYLFFVTAFIACHKKTHPSKSNMVIQMVIVDSSIEKGKTGDPYVIDSVKINDDILTVFINYSGGCKEHSFELYSNGAYAKSLPPQTSVYMVHKGNGDACRELIHQTLQFDLSAIKYSGQNTVIVHVGENHKVRYTYK